jgi:hypothetical protein
MEIKNLKPLDELLPTVITLVGNIKGERPSGPGGKEIRKGTHLFRPNAKVYLSSLKHCTAIYIPEDSDYSIKIVGQRRFSSKWIECWVRADYVTNWRIQVVHKPGAVQRLWKAKWPGFGLLENEFKFREDRNSTETIKEFLEAVAKRNYAQWPKQFRVLPELPN